METSIYFAKVIGLFGALSTFSIIIRYQFHLEMEKNAAKDPVTMYLSGFVFLLLGILITVSHQVWTGDWRVIITILGWMILIKGLFRILFPGTVKKVIDRKQNDMRFLIAESASFFISVYLIYEGFNAST